MLDIQYRDFYDVPRMFVVRLDGEPFLFDGAFDEELDEYPDQYRVYLLPRLGDDELAGSWETLSRRAVEDVGVVPLGAVVFDPTRRKSIRSDVLRALITGRAAHRR